MNTFHSRVTATQPDLGPNTSSRARVRVRVHDPLFPQVRVRVLQICTRVHEYRVHWPQVCTQHYNTIFKLKFDNRFALLLT